MQTLHIQDPSPVIPQSTTDGSRATPTRPANKRTAMTRVPARISPNSSHTLGDSPVSMADPEPDLGNHPETAAAVAKPKRVRTGCLTCRERHLKCDEAMPICQNCRKSNRDCKRGVRLNFIDITVQTPPYLIPTTTDFRVEFHDESREIASEYQGGFAKYAAIEKEGYEMPAEMNYEYSQPIGAPTISHQALPSLGGIFPTYAEPAPTIYVDSNTESYHNHNHSTAASSYTEASQPQRQPFDQTLMVQSEAEQAPSHLETQEEVLYMQVFVEEVALWMDSMDPDKHFSRLLPFQALRQPMLKYAILACGVRHLTLVNSAYPEEKALYHYNNATQLLLKSLQNPERDSLLCATTATILNVYEVMSEKALQRMNHIAGARALIKECKWNARSTGIGVACFWLNVGLELFSCLHFNWGIAWDPDDWGIDMTMVPQQYGGNEEEWCHKILYILAKITNFRSSIPRFQEQSVHAEQMRLHNRTQLWISLRSACEKWNDCIPLTMHPMACIPAYQTSSRSSFPEVWIIKRATIVARLFYHTALALLGGMHPMASMDQSLANEMTEMKVYHSRQICGIVAHVKDRGVASASIRCLAIAGECLTVRREQEEVLEIFEKIKKETGWKVSFLHGDLKEKWGWNNQEFEMMNGGNHSSSFFHQGGTPTMPPIPSQQAARQKPPQGIINPLYKNADFSAPDPPYRGNYVAPASGHILHSNHIFGFSALHAI